METYTVSFFGHRQISNFLQVEERVAAIVRDLICRMEYVEFLLGREGEFDMIVSSVIRRIVRECGRKNSAFVLVLPYMKAECRDNEQSFLSYYDEIEVCPESEGAHFKAAIGIRNRCMVDRSDLVVCCIERERGGAFKAAQYAKKKNKKVVNVAK